MLVGESFDILITIFLIHKNSFLEKKK